MIRKYIMLMVLGLAAKTLFANPPAGYWPQNNAQNTEGTNVLRGISRYNYNTPIPLERFAPGTYISFVYDMKSQQYAWSISNGTWGPSPQNSPNHIAWDAKYVWPSTADASKVPAEMTVPSLGGHSWVKSMLLTLKGVTSGDAMLCGGVLIGADGTASVKYVSGSNKQEFADNRHLKPAYAELLADAVGAVSRGRELSRLAANLCPTECCTVRRASDQSEQ